MSWKECKGHEPVGFIDEKLINRVSSESKASVSEVTVEKMKRDATRWQKVFAKYLPDEKDLFSRYIKSSYKSITR